MNDIINRTVPPRKTKPKGRHPDKALSAAFVRTAPPGRHCDGNGLYLFVQPSGARSWVQRLVIRGRRRDFGLGSVALVSLAEAREKARANRKLAREGGDPLAEKRRAQGVPSFAEAAVRVFEQKQAGWRSEKHRRAWMSTLEPVRLPAHRQDAGLGGDERRSFWISVHLRSGCTKASISPVCTSAHPREVGVGGRDGAPHGQPLRSARVGARATARCGTAHAGPAAPRRGRGHLGRHEHRRIHQPSRLAFELLELTVGPRPGGRCGGPSERRSIRRITCGRFPQRV